MITTELLSILLDEERNEGDRIDSLHELKDYLDQEDIITGLAVLAKKEKNAILRRSLLKIIIEAEITNITNREQYLSILFHFSSIEKETELREIAVNRLADLAFQDEDIELLLAENLLHDTSENIQNSCLLGLQKTRCKYDSTINALSLYAQKVTISNIGSFLKILPKLPVNKSEEIIVELLHPINSETIKTLALNALTNYPSLQQDTLQYILDILLDDTESESLDALAAMILNTRVLQDLAIIDVVIKSLETNPESQAKLLPLLNKLILTGPKAVKKLKNVYRNTNSVSLKSIILSSLNDAYVLDIATEALTDTHLQIRHQALSCCIQNLEKDTQGVIKAILTALKKEPNAYLRSQLAHQVKKVEYLDGDAEKMLLDIYVKEENPWVLETLTKNLFLIPLREDNKKVLLKAYIKTLDETFITDKLKDYAIEQLSNFAYTDTPELMQCLKEFMLREFNINRVEMLYDQYKKLKYDEKEHIELILVLFERFIYFYPLQVLSIWATELKQKVSSNELVGAKAEYLAKITGDNHFLLNQGSLHTTSPLIENIISSVREGQEQIAKQMLQDAYRNRKIKKAEIVQLFKALLTSFDKTGMIYYILDILKEQQLITTDIVNIALDFITNYPDMNLTQNLEQLLSSMGKNLPEYAQCLEESMTPNHFSTYGLRTSKIRTVYDHQWANNWKDIYSDWRVGKLWSELYPGISFLNFFSQPEQEDSQDLNYYILRKLSKVWLKREEKVGEKIITSEMLLLAIGNLINQLEPDDISGSLYDRTLYVFSAQWKKFMTLKEQPSPELSKCATNIYYALYKRWERYQSRVSHELLELPLWLDFDLLSTLLEKDNFNFNEFIQPYYSLLEIEAKSKLQNIFIQKEQPPHYRAIPAFSFLSGNSLPLTVVDCIITAKWSGDNAQILKKSLNLIDKVWQGTVMNRLQMVPETKRHEMLQQIQ